MAKPLANWTKDLNRVQKSLLIVLLARLANEQLGKSFAKMVFGSDVHRIAVSLDLDNELTTTD